MERTSTPCASCVGHAAWEGFSASDRSKKRGQLRAALDEIADRTRGLQGGME
jgi:hypothetical protein